MKPKILYLTRNGLLEPLGQSQILSYLIPLSSDYSFSLISFEKQRDMENSAYFEEIKAVCATHGIKWVPLQYGRRSRVLGIMVGFGKLINTARQIIKQDRVRMIHARSYFPAFVALMFNRSMGVTFVFDMRALWPEELVVSGRIREHSLPYRLVKYLEAGCLKRSGAVISLTAAAASHLVDQHPDIELASKIRVIPTCTNTERFAVKSSADSSEEIVLSCFGTLLSGWFKVDVLRKVIDYFMSAYPSVRFEILTRDKPDLVREAVDPEGKWVERIKIMSVPFERMPDAMKEHAGSMFFYESDTSRLGSFPTRMGESLSVGIPVLANPCVRDVADIIESTKVGVILDEFSAASVKEACEAFMTLIQAEDIVSRCRGVAERVFSLEAGVTSYREAYRQVLGQRGDSMPLA